MQIAIVEDNKLCMQALIDILYQLETQKNEFNIFEYYSGETIIAEYKKNVVQYDIIFLDIQLDRIDGMDTAIKLREMGYKNAIAFTTNNKEYEYMIKGYDVSAIKYIIKPVSMKDIVFCLSRLHTNNHYLFSYKGENVAILFDEILYFESYNHYVYIYTQKTKYTQKINLSDISLPYEFVRCHRSFIVNIRKISKIKGDILYLLDKSEIKIGKKYIDSVHNSFRNIFMRR